MNGGGTRVGAWSQRGGRGRKWGRGHKGAEPHLIGPQDVVGGAQHHHIGGVIAEPQQPAPHIWGAP